jgi:hypothetical protein
MGKLLKKIGTAAKKFTQSKVGKVVLTAGAIAGGLAIGNAATGGMLVKGIASGGKKLLSKVGSKKRAQASEAGLTAGDDSEPLPKKGLFGFKRKGNKKGIGGARLDEQEKASLLSGSTARIGRKLRKRKGLNKQEKAELNEVAKTIDDQAAKVSPEFNESVNGNEIRSIVRSMPIIESAGGYNSYSGSDASFASQREVSDVQVGEGITPKKVMTAFGIGAGLYGLGKLTGLIK